MSHRIMLSQMLKWNKIKKIFYAHCIIMLQDCQLSEYNCTDLIVKLFFNQEKSYFLMNKCTFIWAKRESLTLLRAEDAVWGGWKKKFTAWPRNSSKEKNCFVIWSLSGEWVGPKIFQHPLIGNNFYPGILAHLKCSIPGKIIFCNLNRKNNQKFANILNNKI